MTTAPTYDTLEDELLTALGLVCGKRVNAALDLEGGDAIRNVYLFPLTLSQIPSVQTPALAIYRTQTQYHAHGAVGVWWRDTLRFDYFAPRTSRMKLSTRWPLLHQVTKELFAALCDGTWDGVAHLENVGVQDYNRESFVSRYTYAESDSHAWPVSQTTFVLDWQPVSEEDLPDATELLAQQLRDDASDFIVSSLHTLPT